MKERLLDVIKWAIIIVIAAAAFYIVFPKYQFMGNYVRGNRITGRVEEYKDDGWHSLKRPYLSPEERGWLYGD